MGSLVSSVTCLTADLISESVTAGAGPQEEAGLASVVPTLAAAGGQHEDAGFEQQPFDDIAQLC